MKEKKPLIIEVSVGILLICAGFFIRAEYYSTMIFSMGIGIVFTSAVQLLRITYWQNPKRCAEYEAKKREAHINRVDERKQYLRMRAGHVTYQIMTFSFILLSLVLALLRVDAWVTAMVFFLFVFQCLVGIIVFRVLEKRM
ncbi:MAG: DUF2178 domain-containing protein [Eubacteriales bacterium]|nr:DUF2178 domain-containing protein [Eubacteriales bacterium]